MNLSEEKNLSSFQRGSIKLDVGCGDVKHEGFTGIDYRKTEAADIVHDLEMFPWPLKDESCFEAISLHVIEHINPHKGVFMKFMDEVWRVLIPNGTFYIATPHAGTTRYFQDPTHCNPCVAETFYYFDCKHEYYTIYRPKPWSIENIRRNNLGDLEILLKKCLTSKEKKHQL